MLPFNSTWKKMCVYMNVYMKKKETFYTIEMFW